MIVSDRLSFADIDGLDQVEPGMMYPDSPKEDSNKPYRVSAYVKDSSGKPIVGSDVGLYKVDGKTVIETKKTDSAGKVFFDVAGDVSEVVLVPQISGSSPPYVKMAPIAVSPGFFKYLFVNSWSWDKSAIFTGYVGIPAVPPSVPPAERVPETNYGPLFVAVALAVGGYLIYRWQKGGTGL